MGRKGRLALGGNSFPIPRGIRRKGTLGSPLDSLECLQEVERALKGTSTKLNSLGIPRSTDTPPFTTGLPGVLRLWSKTFLPP